MRVVFMGTPDAAVPALRALGRSRHEVMAVVTQPDRPSSRGRRLTAPPVKEAALELGLPVLQPESVKTAAVRHEIAAFRADLLVVVAYGKILGERLLAVAPAGAVNLHFSLLPRWRGAAPVQRAILAGDQVSGVSIIRLVRELDAGPVLARLPLPIEPGEHAPSLEARMAIAGAGLLVETLDALSAGDVTETEQDESEVTLAPPLSREEGWLDAACDARDLERVVRALDPWPGARLRLPAGVVAVVDAVAEDADGGTPGTLLPPRGDDLPLACGRGTLLLRRVRPEGRAAMSGRSLVNGRFVAPMDRVVPGP